MVVVVVVVGAVSNKKEVFGEFTEEKGEFRIRLLSDD